jgi:hypothetical protein
LLLYCHEAWQIGALRQTGGIEWPLTLTSLLPGRLTACHSSRHSYLNEMVELLEHFGTFTVTEVLTPSHNVFPQSFHNVIPARA